MLHLLDYTILIQIFLTNALSTLFMFIILHLLHTYAEDFLANVRRRKLIHFCLLRGKHVIALKWKDIQRPNSRQWIKAMSCCLIRMTYLHNIRGNVWRCGLFSYTPTARVLWLWSGERIGWLLNCVLLFLIINYVSKSFDVCVYVCMDVCIQKTDISQSTTAKTIKNITMSLNVELADFFLHYHEHDYCNVYSLVHRMSINPMLKIAPNMCWE